MLNKIINLIIILFLQIIQIKKIKQLLYHLTIQATIQQIIQTHHTPIQTIALTRIMLQTISQAIITLMQTLRIIKTIRI